MILRGVVVGNQAYSIEIPAACPICRRHSEMSIITADRIEDGAGVEVVFRCGFQGCRVFFAGFYDPVPSERLKFVRPLRPPEAVFSKIISELSPTFVSVFTEAAEVKHLGLNQVAGPGYRKAFEFLIKDYAKSLVPGTAEDATERREQIEKKFSGTVVKDFIPDVRIQAVATRSLWLGNDETHYLRKWTDRDLADLVTLIELTVQWIEIDVRSRAYIQEMPENSR